MASTLRERFVDRANRVGERFLRWLDAYFARHSLVGDKTFFDPESFAWIARVEDRVPAIQSELDDVLRWQDELPNFQDISTDQAQLTSDDRWKTFFFCGYGFDVTRNKERCPETAAALRVLRYHLALKVPGPPDACRIRVGDDLRSWVEGKSLVFDDVNEHEAWNDTDGTRVVLFVDFVRPLAGTAKWVNAAMIKVIGWSPFVQDAKARHQAWERRFETIRNRAA